MLIDVKYTVVLTVKTLFTILPGTGKHFEYSSDRGMQ